MPASSIHNGWRYDPSNTRLDFYYRGTRVGHVNASGLQSAGTLAATGITTLSDELRVANGKNVRVGTISAFATTEPTNAIVFKAGTEFAGAITTSGGLMASATVVRKVIADGTVSNVET